MTDLPDFLLARIAEDEDQARTFLADNHAALVRAGLPFRDSAMSFVVRVLAECEAKRRIVEHHTPHRGDDEFPLCSICTEVGPNAQGWPCLTLRALALPYSDHPDYREEWKP